MKTNPGLNAKWLSGVFIALCCVPLVAQAVGPKEQDQLAAMQKVIDQQQSEISNQKKELDTQQQRLDEQQKALEALQSQMQSLLAAEDTDDEADVESVSMDDQPETPADSVADATKPPETSDAKAPARIAHSAGARERPNQHQVALGTEPLDIPDDTGLFIFSNDSHKMIRLYGSMRMMSVFDNRQNFHPYDLNIPQVPVGADNVKNVNSNWTIKASRLGLEIDVRDLLSVKAEFDWKGDNEALRIRHMYMRTDHWLVGQHWNAFSTIKFLPQSIDSHSTSAHVGVRPPQVKYLGARDNWSYEAALEYFQPKVEAPDAIDANSSNIIPNIVGHLDYNQPWGTLRGAMLIAPNKVKYVGGSQSSDLGVSLQLAALIHINENNQIKTHVLRTVGSNTYIPDYCCGGKFDMVYNPATGDFHNLTSVGGQIALEHKWN